MWLLVRQLLVGHLATFLSLLVVVSNSNSSQTFYEENDLVAIPYDTLLKDTLKLHVILHSH